MGTHTVTYYGISNYEYMTAWIPIQNLPQNIHDTHRYNENMNNKIRRDGTENDEMVTANTLGHFTSKGHSPIIASTRRFRQHRLK